MYVMRKKDKSSYVLSLPPAPVILCEFSNWLPISPSPPKKNKCLHNILYFLRLKDKSDMACSATSETQNKSLNKCLTRQHLLKPKTTHDRVRACFGGNILIMMMGFFFATHTHRSRLQCLKQRRQTAYPWCFDLVQRGEWCCFCTLPVPDGLGSRDWDLSSVCFRLDILNCVWGPCVSCLHPVVSHFWSCQGRTFEE